AAPSRANCGAPLPAGGAAQGVYRDLIRDPQGSNSFESAGTAFMTLIASLLPLLCWLAYNSGVGLIERHRPSLSSIMSMQRRRWVANITRRESPLDAILSGNLMQAVSLLASTSVLIVLAIFAAFGSVKAMVDMLASIGLGLHYSEAELQFHLLMVLTIFVA